VTLAIHPVTADRWYDLVDLFERRGPRGGHRNSPAAGCWCMYWRNRSVLHGTQRKRAMARGVRAGREPGLLAYRDGAPIGWVSIAPRDEYESLLQSPQYRPRDDDRDIWSLVCFVVDRPERGSGVADELLEAAVAHACARSAAAIEAYAHVTDAHDYMGSRALYETHGFHVVRPANKRVVMRKAC